MPFTPFHAGPHVTVGFILKNYIDLPVFVLANVVIDLEPLAVMVFKLNYPLHGYLHTFLIGGLAGLLWGIIAGKVPALPAWLMSKANLEYTPCKLKMAISGLAGAWLHILFDAPIYHDIRPFFPLATNPLYGLVERPDMYKLCALLFLPALLMFIVGVYNFRKADKK